MRLPDKLPSNMTEAKAMFKDISDQVIEKVTELCNNMGKHADAAEKKVEAEVAEVKAESAEKKAEVAEAKAEETKPAAKDSETPPQA